MMTGKQKTPYGSWKSPISSDLIVQGSIGLGGIMLENKETYWLEGRPSEGGRVVIVHRSAQGDIKDVIPNPFNARSRVHEYGGGSYTVHKGVVYFVNFTDQRIYRTTVGNDPDPLTEEKPWRYADLIMDESRERLICVREDHSQPEKEAMNSIVAISLPSGKQTILVSGNDFYASPRINAKEDKLVWLTWNHPNMPWDGTELWLADLNQAGEVENSQFVAGGLEESIFQPEWSLDQELYFVSDRTGWWNLYHWKENKVQPVLTVDAEFGLPQWVFGMATYDFLSRNRVICAYTRDGIWQLGILDSEKQALSTLELPYTTISQVRSSNERIVINGASAREPHSIIQINPENGDYTVLKKATNIEIDVGYLSRPQPVEFATEANLTAHGLFYAPQNKDYEAPQGVKPPLIVMIHGGPTSATDTALNLGLQYWTSRGFAVLDVNYGGSTGYGRTYRNRLYTQWGVVDVDDCVNGALYLVQAGQVDPNRLLIRGGSAGGYTTLAALTFRDVFSAGASHFGVSDLTALATDTHKFESRYLDKMVGPFPEKHEVYTERSPLQHAQKLSKPVIFFQGLDDRVVPPNQAETLVDVLRKKGVPVAYLAFEGEGHGFRKAENIKRALEAELYFYQRVFGMPVDPDIQPIKIENLA